MLGLIKKQAEAVLDTLKNIVIAHLAQEGPQHFKWPGLFNMKVKEKVATGGPRSPGRVNRLTEQPTTFAAKPAKRVVKIAALNSLKDLVEVRLKLYN